MRLLLFITTCLCLSLVYGDKNGVFQPCADTLVQRKDGFTLGFAFASFDSFFINKTLALSPCDQRLSLHTKNSHLALFRPTLDQISLLTINTTSDPIQGGNMVAFAGSNYAAISSPQFVFDEKLIITSFTLVLHFDKGRLQNLLWKNYGWTDKHSSMLNSWYEVNKMHQYSLFGLYPDLKYNTI
ncbi:hypothetical protein SUGI_0912090 [Cryptomeria japonica]|nr:hypothetical protein SUGI_0912090 [Cryptomeria japonica]